MILNCFIQEANVKFLIRNLQNSKGGKFPENKKGTIGKVCHIFCFVSNLNWLGRGVETICLDAHQLLLLVEQPGFQNC